MPDQKTSAPEQRSYDNVILVQRVLAVLQSVNRLPIITIKGIAEECGIPRPSVVRIVETLCAEGFLVRVSRSAGYALTSKIRTLSAGYHGAPLIVEVLKAYADNLTRSHLWPCSVATLERNAMVIQYSSIPLSPFAHVRTTMHKRLSLVSRAHGIAYVAFCSSTERHRLVRLATALDNPEDRIVADAYSWRRQIVLARRRGYAERLSEADTFTNTIAVPVQIEPGRVVATLGVTFFRSVVREAQIWELAGALKTAASLAAERVQEELILRIPTTPGLPPDEGRTLRRTARLHSVKPPADPDDTDAGVR